MSTRTTFCDHCGDPLSGPAHETCARRRELEPPRYCAECRRRMTVQVTPRGWTAKCVEHGMRTSP
ncbi:hypothetical protein [Embleya sp. AB8]|uniref:biotin synthase auxiliary protein BsaP n=1 Tax=Embleya sp. AB8 TaxID=3156304 RepID=UPI003C762A63